MKAIKVLLVDPDSQMSQLIKALLENCLDDCAVTTVESGEKALKLFQPKKDYDVVVTALPLNREDETNPMDSRSLLTGIKSIRAVTPVIFFAASPDSDQEETCIEQGFDDFTDKIHTSELAEKVFNSLPRF